MNNDEIKKLEIFQFLEEASLHYLTAHSVLKEHKKGDVICRKDGHASAVYFIKQGVISEYVMDGNGFNINVKMSGTGECFGELGVLIGNGYYTTAIAATDVELFMFPGAVFEEVVWSNQKMVKHILARLILKLQKSAQKSISYTLFNSEGRLAYVLSTMSNEDLHKKEIGITQEELGFKCGIARQTVSVTLSKWKKQGIISLTRGKIRVLKPDLLTEVVMNCAKEH
ncbi:Crp/Fnr family transcriptional regulator [Anoxynatronum sibiricum]|uniref:Crp/Fnr family transcriptional regulator n=1 Tax=Anoxynatronum sibiricum TaxID=210623 RepID=A0ABU9VTW0_9CLOT